MLDFKDAKRIIEKNLPNGIIKSAILYDGSYVFMVFIDEDEFDPFYSVDSENGEFRDFSILTDGDTSTIIRNFALNNLIKE